MIDFGAVHGNPFWVSLRIGVVATALCVGIGTPLAWWIARRERAINGVVSSLVLLPLVLPPTAIGYYLLYVFGRQSASGRFLIDEVGLRLVFTWQGAALAAAVPALPLFVRTAQAGFEQLDRRLIEVASTLATSQRVFWRVALPLAWPSLAAAVLIAFARSVGEFGATLIVAGNIPGRTQTVPTAIYDAVQAGDTGRANAIALVLLFTSFWVLAVFAFLFSRRVRR